MKNIFYTFIIAILFCSCAKKHTYNCYVVSNVQPGTVLLSEQNRIEKTMTERQKDRFIKNNTKDLDGVDYIYTYGESLATCILVN